MPLLSGCHTIWRSGSTASPRASVASASAIKSTHSPIGSSRSTSAFEITRTSTTISFRTAASTRTGEVLGGHETRGREASHEAIGQGERELLRMVEVGVGGAVVGRSVLTRLNVCRRQHELETILDVPCGAHAVFNLP